MASIQNIPYPSVAAGGIIALLEHDKPEWHFWRTAIVGGVAGDAELFQLGGAIWQELA